MKNSRLAERKRSDNPSLHTTDSHALSVNLVSQATQHGHALAVSNRETTETRDPNSLYCGLSDRAESLLSDAMLSSSFRKNQVGALQRTVPLSYKSLPASLRS